MSISGKPSLSPAQDRFNHWDKVALRTSDTRHVIEAAKEDAFSYSPAGDDNAAEVVERYYLADKTLDPDNAVKIGIGGTADAPHSILHINLPDYLDDEESEALNRFLQNDEESRLKRPQENAHLTADKAYAFVTWLYDRKQKQIDSLMAELKETTNKKTMLEEAQEALLAENLKENETHRNQSETNKQGIADQWAQLQHCISLYQNSIGDLQTDIDRYENFDPLYKVEHLSHMDDDDYRQWRAAQIARHHVQAIDANVSELGLEPILYDSVTVRLPDSIELEIENQDNGNDESGNNGTLIENTIIPPMKEFNSSDSITDSDAHDSDDNPEPYLDSISSKGLENSAFSPKSRGIDSHRSIINIAPINKSNSRLKIIQENKNQVQKSCSVKTLHPERSYDVNLVLNHEVIECINESIGISNLDKKLLLHCNIINAMMYEYSLLSNAYAVNTEAANVKSSDEKNLDLTQQTERQELAQSKKDHDNGSKTVSFDARMDNNINTLIDLLTRGEVSKAAMALETLRTNLPSAFPQIENNEEFERFLEKASMICQINTVWQNYHNTDLKKALSKAMQAGDPDRNKIESIYADAIAFLCTRHNIEPDAAAVRRLQSEYYPIPSKFLKNLTLEVNARKRNHSEANSITSQAKGDRRRSSLELDQDRPWRNSTSSLSATKRSRAISLDDSELGDGVRAGRKRRGSFPMSPTFANSQSRQGFSRQDTSTSIATSSSLTVPVLNGNPKSLTETKHSVIIHSPSLKNSISQEDLKFVDEEKSEEKNVYLDITDNDATMIGQLIAAGFKEHEANWIVNFGALRAHMTNFVEDYSREHNKYAGLLVKLFSYEVDTEETMVNQLSQINAGRTERTQIPAADAIGYDKNSKWDRRYNAANSKWQKILHENKPTTDNRIDATARLKTIRKMKNHLAEDFPALGKDENFDKFLAALQEYFIRDWAVKVIEKVGNEVEATTSALHSRKRRTLESLATLKAEAEEVSKELETQILSDPTQFGKIEELRQKALALGAQANHLATEWNFANNYPLLMFVQDTRNYSYRKDKESWTESRFTEEENKLLENADSIIQTLITCVRVMINNESDNKLKERHIVEDFAEYSNALGKTQDNLMIVEGIESLVQYTITELPYLTDRKKLYEFVAARYSAVDAIHAYRNLHGQVSGKLKNFFEPYLRNEYGQFDQRQWFLLMNNPEKLNRFVNEHFKNDKDRKIAFLKHFSSAISCLNRCAQEEKQIQDGILENTGSPDWNAIRELYEIMGEDFSEYEKWAPSE